MGRPYHRTRAARLLQSLVVLVVATTACVALARTWTDRTQKHKIQGEFVSLVDGVVCIEREDGKQVKIPLEKLSLFDQDYAKRASAETFNRPKPRSEKKSADTPSETVTTPPQESIGAITNEGGSDKQVGVIAEGVGTTPREALEDAFRSAVRQVVGAAVDTESVMKNDEIIEDKILTFSNGFVKNYEKVSETSKSGLVRVKIKAMVSRGELEQRLKAESISIASVNGASLFAETVSQINAAKDSTSMIQNALKDLPNLLTAQVVGKPEYDRDKSEIEVRVVLQADQQAYDAYQKKLVEVLERLAVSQVEVLMKGTSLIDDRDGPTGFLVGSSVNRNLLGPSVPDSSHWCIWVNTFRNKTYDTLKWKCFIVKGDFRPVMKALEVQTVDDDGNSVRLQGQTTVTIGAHDGSDTVVTAQEVTVVAGVNEANSDGGLYTHYGIDATSRLPFLRHFALRDLSGRFVFTNWTRPKTAMLEQDERRRIDPNMTATMYVAPLFLTFKPDAEHKREAQAIIYSPTRTGTLRIPVTLEDLSEITSIKATVSHSSE
jgi:hypothetical protein